MDVSGLSSPLVMSSSTKGANTTSSSTSGGGGGGGGGKKMLQKITAALASSNSSSSSSSSFSSSVHENLRREIDLDIAIDPEIALKYAMSRGETATDAISGGSSDSGGDEVASQRQRRVAGVGLSVGVESSMDYDNNNDNNSSDDDDDKEEEEEELAVAARFAKDLDAVRCNAEFSGTEKQLEVLREILKGV